MASFAPIGNDQYMYGHMEGITLENTFQKTDTEETKKIFEMKECILDILHGKCELPYEEITEESKKYIEDNTDLVSKIKSNLQLFSKLQKELYEVDDEFQKELHYMKQQIGTMDTMISFIQKLPEETRKEEDMKLIIEKMNTIGGNIQTTEKITTIKKRYNEKRQVLESHLNLIKLINQGNHSNLCAICLEKPVDHYSNPCGHTACKTCFDKNKQELITNENMVQSHMNYKCPFCRIHIQSIKPLYFL
jgi:hypothetical protein